MTATLFDAAFNASAFVEIPGLEFANSRLVPDSMLGGRFGWALYGQPEEALLALDDFLARFDLSINWQVIMANRARMPREKLVTDPELAHDQLREWERDSIRSLKLEALRQ